MNTRKRDQPLASRLTLATPEWLAAPTDLLDPLLVEISAIHLPASQPRRYFDPQTLAQLSDSIRHSGVLQPILVRPRCGGGYELVAGERRLRAATAAELNEIPAIVRDLSDLEARQIALLENLQREDLNLFEETVAIVDLIALHLNQPAAAIPGFLRQRFNTHQRSPRELQVLEGDSDNNVIISPDLLDADDSTALNQEIEQIFQQLGMMNWQSFVTNRLPLLNLPVEIQEALREGRIAYTKAKIIANVKDEAARSQLLANAIAQEWSLSEIKAQIAATKTKEKLPIQQQIDASYRQIKKAKIWQDPRKQVRLEALLKELNSLLDE